MANYELSADKALEVLAQHLLLAGCECVALDDLDGLADGDRRAVGALSLQDEAFCNPSADSGVRRSVIKETSWGEAFRAPSGCWRDTLACIGCVCHRSEDAPVPRDRAEELAWG